MSSTEKYHIPHRQQKRLAPGEIAMGVGFAEKGVDPSPPPVPPGSLLVDNPSAHSGYGQQYYNAVAEHQPEVDQQIANLTARYEAQIADLQAQLAAAQGGQP